MHDKKQFQGKFLVGRTEESVTLVAVAHAAGRRLAARLTYDTEELFGGHSEGSRCRWTCGR